MPISRRVLGNKDNLHSRATQMHTTPFMYATHPAAAYEGKPLKNLLCLSQDDNDNQHTHI